MFVLHVSTEIVSSVLRKAQDWRLNILLTWMQCFKLCWPKKSVIHAREENNTVTIRIA